MMAANGKMHALAIALVLAGTGCAHGAAQAHVQHGAVSIKFGASGDVVRFDPLLLTATTIDVCALKLGLDFTDPLLTTLAGHLAPSVLRIGGTDQNSFHYNMPNTRPMSPCECSMDCTMTGRYWDEVLAFTARTGLDLLFGLAPWNSTNAISLIDYTARQQSAAGSASTIFGYSYGNEELGDAALAQRYLTDMTAVRAGLVKAYAGKAAARPLLVGADTGVGPRLSTLPSNYSQDPYIIEHLAWIKTFVAVCSSVLDAVSWHTYDFRAREIGTTDHHPLPYPPLGDNVSKLWDPEYLAVAGKLSDNVTAVVNAAAGGKPIPVWLTETNSVCHQGVFNDTNAFLNTLWLVNRLGMMAQRGVPLMARQSLIGFNYSLLGNYPEEPLVPSPDYYATVLYRTLVGGGSIEVETSNPRLPMYGYCGKAGGVVATFVSLDESAGHDVAIPAALQTGPRVDYALTPHWTGAATATARERATSRAIDLNGALLQVTAAGGLPAMEGKPAPSGRKGSVTVPPLSVLFSVFPDATHAGC